MSSYFNARNAPPVAGPQFSQAEYIEPFVDVYKLNIEDFYQPTNLRLRTNDFEKQDIADRNLIITPYFKDKTLTEDDKAGRSGAARELAEKEAALLARWYRMARHINTTNLLNCTVDAVSVLQRNELPLEVVNNPEVQDILNELNSLRQSNHDVRDREALVQNYLEIITALENLRRRHFDMDSTRESMRVLFENLRNQPHNSALHEQAACLLQSIASETVQFTQRNAPTRALKSDDGSFWLRGIFRKEYSPFIFPRQDIPPPFILRAARLPEPVADSGAYDREVLKTNASMLNEAIVGLYGTNALREHIPNFAYIYGSFMAPGLVNAARLSTQTGATDDMDGLFAREGDPVAARANNPPRLFAHPEWTHYNMIETISSVGANVLAPTLRAWLEANNTDEVWPSINKNPAAFDQALFSIISQVILSLCAAKHVIGEFSHNNLTIDSVVIQSLNSRVSIVYPVREASTRSSSWLSLRDTSDNNYTVETDFIAKIVDYRNAHISFVVEDRLQQYSYHRDTERRGLYDVPEGDWDNRERVDRPHEEFHNLNVIEADLLLRNPRSSALSAAATRSFATRRGDMVTFRTGGFDALNGRTPAAAFYLGDITRFLFSLYSFPNIRVRAHVQRWLSPLISRENLLKISMDSREGNSDGRGVNISAHSVFRGVDIEPIEYFERALANFKNERFVNVRSGDMQRDYSFWNAPELNCDLIKCFSDSILEEVTRESSELRRATAPTLPDYTKPDPNFFTGEIVDGKIAAAPLLRDVIADMNRMLSRDTIELIAIEENYRQFFEKARAGKWAARNVKDVFTKNQKTLDRMFARGRRDAQKLDTTFNKMLTREMRVGIITPGDRVSFETLHEEALPSIQFFLGPAPHTEKERRGRRPTGASRKNVGDV